MKRSAADERFTSGNEPKVARVSSLQYLAKRVLPEGAEVPDAVRDSVKVAPMGRPDPIFIDFSVFAPIDEPIARYFAHGTNDRYVHARSKSSSTLANRLGIIAREEDQQRRDESYDMLRRYLLSGPSYTTDY